MYKWCILTSFKATGDMNKFIMIWEAETCKRLYKFTGHKGPVSVRPSHSSVGPVRAAAPLPARHTSAPLAGSLVQEGDSRPLQRVSRPLGQSVERGWKCLRGNSVSVSNRSSWFKLRGAVFSPSLSAASAIRPPSRAWTVWAASAAWRREGGTARWGCGRSPRSRSWSSTATSESLRFSLSSASSKPCFIVKRILNKTNNKKITAACWEQSYRTWFSFPWRRNSLFFVDIATLSF